MKPQSDFRGVALLMVTTSGLILFFVGCALQVAVCDLQTMYRHTALPELTRLFLDSFGLRSHGYLTAVVFWFWWPFVLAFVYCCCKYSNRAEFAVAFFYSFVAIWLIVALFIAFIALICVLPRVIALEDLRQPPQYMAVVPVLSWLLPVVVTTMSLLMMWRFKQKGAQEAE